MPRGGYRPGAGRPKKASAGSAPKAAAVTVKVPSEVSVEARRAGLDPLSYMLAVMNDEEADEARRDRMAIAAAPFVHAKADAVAPGKKEQRQAGAEQVAAAGRFAPRLAPKLAVDNTR